MYIVKNALNDTFCVICHTREDAQELILSIVEEELYDEFCYYNYAIECAEVDEYDYAWAYSESAFNLYIKQCAVY